MQLRAGRDYVRLNPAATRAGVAMAPWSQVLQEYPEMAALQRSDIQEVSPAGGRRDGADVLPPGYAAPPPPTPRRVSFATPSSGSEMAGHGSRIAPLVFRTLTWIGIIEQLQRTRRADPEAARPGPEFSMLVHFSHGHPPEKTVTGIASDMQQLQPAADQDRRQTGRQRLREGRANAADGRSKVLTI